MKHFHVGVRPKLVFLHLPKTAGTSMKRYLADQYYWPFISPATDWTSYIEQGEPKFSNFQLVYGHFDLSVLPLVSPEARLLTILRNPLSRTLSTIRHMQRDPNFSMHYEEVRHMTLSEILRSPKYIDMVSNSQTGWLSGPADIKAILPDLRKAHQDGNAIDLGYYKSSQDIIEAKDTLHRIDFVGISENLGSLLAQLSSTMGYHPTNLFRRDNVAPDGASDYTGISKTDLKLLESYNALDIELYEYCQALIQERSHHVRPVTVNAAIEKLVSRAIYDVMTDSFELDLSAPLPGSGWHDAEKHGNFARWTGPFNQFTLEIPLDSSKSFCCKVSYYCIPGVKQQDIAVTVDGERVELSHVLDGDAHTIIFDVSMLSEVCSLRVCQIVFTLSEMFRPADWGEDDIRTLGVLVESVRFECT